MNTLGKYIVVALIGILVGAIASSKLFKPKPVIETVVVVDTIVKTVVDSIPFTIIDTIKVKSKPVVITIPSDNPSVPPVLKETTKYTGKEELSNGTIDYEIYADSLYATKFKLTVEEKTIYKNITNTVTLPTKSRLYLGGGVDMDMVNNIPQEASVGLMYNRRQKWAISATINTDLTGLLPPENATSFGVKLWFGL